MGGGGIQKITRGMKWIAVTVGPGPKMPARWITEAASPQAAQDLKGLETRAYQMAFAQLLKGDGEADAAFQKRLADLANSYRSTVEGTRLTAEWEVTTTILEAGPEAEGQGAGRRRPDHGRPAPPVRGEPEEHRPGVP